MGKIMKYLPIAVVLLVATGAYGQTDCSAYNTGTLYEPLYINQNTLEHSSGSHFWQNQGFGSCSYSGYAQTYSSVGCTAVATAQSNYNGGDSGGITRTLASHYMNANQKAGSMTSSGGSSATADTEAALAVQSCVFSCSTTITISGSGQGAGFSVTYNPTTLLWEDTNHWINNCPGETLAPTGYTSSCPGPTSPYPTSSGGSGSYQWNSSTCTWVWVPTQNTSPIIIDTTNKGFVFTDPTKGKYVTFDLKGDGTYLKLSWPAPDSGNAWLVYDRDGDGVIKDGTELFGSFSPHADGGHPDALANGFLALGWYDLPAQGGNGDAVIDKKDAIWNKLRLWIDTHCYQQPEVPCQSLPSELFPLPSKGINSLPLVYGYDRNYTDTIGNQFKLDAVVNPDIENAPINADGRHVNAKGETCCDLHQKSSTDGRLMYDVWLRVVQ